MLSTQFSERPVKGATTTDPLIDDDAQGVLIAGRTGFPLDLLRSHVGNSPYDILGTLVARTLCRCSNTKVAQQDLIAPPYQHILWLDISMDKLFIVGILQGICHLLHVGYNGH